MKNKYRTVSLETDFEKDLLNTDFKYSKKIWANTMESYLKDKEVTWYQLPNNVVGVIVDPITGNLATNESQNKKILYYIKGTEPNYIQEVFDEIVKNYSGMSLSDLMVDVGLDIQTENEENKKFGEDLTKAIMGKTEKSPSE